MLHVLENEEGERAVVTSLAGFAKLRPFDAVARRFEDAVVIHRLPLAAGAKGGTAAVRMLIAAMEAVYPDPGSNRLGVVDSDGKVLHGPGSTATLGRATGTAGRTILSRLLEQRHFSPSGGWIIHL